MPPDAKTFTGVYHEPCSAILDAWLVIPVVGNEGWDVYAELDGSDNLVTRYINGDATNQVFARVDANGVAWLLTDALNSTRDVIDNTGTLLDHLDYDAFGTITYELNPTLAGAILFTGDHYDAETGFDFSRARYLDPDTGRWTTQDPLGFGGEA